MARPAKPSPEQTLDAIIERAERARAAGVLEFEVGGVRVKLAPPSLPADPGPPQSRERAEVHASPLEDPASFGLPPGAAVPGFRRPQEEML